MRRLRTSLAAAAGGTLALLIGTGFIALISDSVTSPDNSVVSGDLVVASHDVKAAVIDSTTNCDGMTPLSDGPIAVAASGDTIDLNGGSFIQQTDFCIRNDGTQTARLIGTISSVVDTEVACSTGESEAGDATCGQGAGELSPVLLWSMPSWQPPNVTAYTSATCSGAQTTEGFVMPGALELDPTLATGETCRVYLTIGVDGTAPQNDLLLAQSDQLQFDVVFTLEDAA